ncbi:MAG: hypothetical protein L3K13_05490 [Thermoplasmata archaeon]|nr:hypothetical protein [Thermoplasmata archaeon]
MVPTVPIAPASPIPVPAPAGMADRLDRAGEYDQVFAVVRDAVWRHLRRERSGLGLGLAQLPPYLGGFWPVTGNLLVLNESLVESVRAHARSPRELNGFLFVLLAHEYIHALGYLDERSTRKLTAEVALAAFGPEHPATKLASGDLWRMLPFLRDAPSDGSGRLRIVSGFDRGATASYIR